MTTEREMLQYAAKAWRNGMTPIREWEAAVGKWCPPIVLMVVWLLLLPLRVAALLLIPADARFTWHPLHKIYNFWRFRKH